MVRGCKLHISEASIADEIMVIPTRALGPDEKDYAVAFAVPADHEGVKQVLSIHNFRKRKNYKRGFQSAGIPIPIIIFDNVFVPWDRVFLCGENDHGGLCALLFALFHRHSYSGCKPAIGDVMTGMASLAAKINGVRKTGHVREMLAEFIKITELGYAAGYTASAMGKPEVYIPGMGPVPYGPGSCIPNSIYANVGRCLTGEAVFQEQEMLCSIAGGLPATFPNEADLDQSRAEAPAGKVPQPQSRCPGGGPDQVLAALHRLFLLRLHRPHELRQLPWRRFAHHGADRHHLAVQHQAAGKPCEQHCRHMRN